MSKIIKATHRRPYGNCALCGYCGSVQYHHIIPKRLKVKTDIQTRFIYADVEGDEDKINSVNMNTAEIYANPDKKMEALEEGSWIKKMIEILENDPKRGQSLIPFAALLLGKINGKSIINGTNPRSMRDFKRVLHLTSAKTWLFQQQRKRGQKKGVNFVLSDIKDFLEVLEYSQELFNSTFEGVDGRLKNVLDLIDNYESEWTPRDYLQDKLGKTKNTIKAWCQTLADDGLIEGSKGSELNMNGMNLGFHASKIYYKRCHKGIKEGLITCQLSELKTYLESKEEEINIIINNITKETTELEEEKEKSVCIPSENDPFKLTPFEKPTKEQYYSLTDQKIVMQNGSTLPTSGNIVLGLEPSEIKILLDNQFIIKSGLEVKNAKTKQ